MEVVNSTYLPGDPRLIDHIVYELKSQGIFDNFRKECIADVDTKPAYQNLRQRVEGSVSGFLKTQKWRSDMNKNHVREMLRKNISESGFLETGVERIVDQVVNPKINTIFLPQVENVVYIVLGIQKPTAFDDLKKEDENVKLDLLPNDLEAVSPESEPQEKKLDVSNESQKLNDKLDEDESPPFEPIEETVAPEENSVDSNLSGISGLVSHDSNHSIETMIKEQPMEISNQDSQFSKHSSEDRLSIVMSDEQETKLEMNDDSNVSSVKIIDTNSKSADMPDSQSSSEKNLQISSSSEKLEETKTSEEKRHTEKKSDRHHSSHRHSSHKSKHDSKDHKNDKDRKSDRDRKDHRSSKSSHDSKERKDRDKEKKGKSERDGESKGNKESKSDKDRDRHNSSSRHSKDKTSKRDSSDGKSKESKDSSEPKDGKTRTGSEKKDTKTSESKDRSKDDSKSKSHSSKKSRDDSKSHSKHNGKSKTDSSDSTKPLSKDSKRSDKSHKKDDRHHSSSHSSDRKSDKHDKKESKKDIKRDSKDDHYSLKEKKIHRRSTDRDSSDGHSGTHSSSSSLTDLTTPSQLQKCGQESSLINSGASSGDSGNSDGVNSLLETCNTDSVSCAVSEENTQMLPSSIPQLKLIKPKFASNIFEARRLMKIRKKLGKLEKQKQIELIRVNNSGNKVPSASSTDFNNQIVSVNITESDVANTDQLKRRPNILKKHSNVTKLKFNLKNKKEEKLKENKKPIETLRNSFDEENFVEVVQAADDESPSLQTSVISKESWDAIEAKLNAQNILKVDYNSYTESKESVTKIVNTQEKSFKGFNAGIETDTEKKVETLSIIIEQREIELAKLSKAYLLKLAEKDKSVSQKGSEEFNQLNRLPKIEKVDVTSTNEIVFSPGRGIKRIANDHTDIHNNNKVNKGLGDILCVRLNDISESHNQSTAKIKKPKLTESSVNLENFNLPLSPADSDKSFNSTNDKKNEVPEGRTRRPRATSNQRYSSDDLYKPRLQFSSKRRRSTRNSDKN